MGAELKNEKSIFTGTIGMPLLALFCGLLWSSAFPFVKLGYEYFQIDSSDTGSILYFAGLRYFFAGILGIAAGSIIKKRFIYPKKGSWGMVAKLASMQTVAQYTTFYIGLAHATGSHSAIINASKVFISILIGSLIFKQENLTSRKVIGCIFGFAGILMVNLKGGDLTGGFSLMGEGLIFASAISNAISTSINKIYCQEEDPTVLAEYQFLLGGAVLTIIGKCMGGHINPTSPTAYWLLAYLCALSAVAYFIWSHLLKMNPISKVTIYSFCQPLFGVVLSMLMLKENIDVVRSLISLVLVTIGIMIVNHHPTAHKGPDSKPAD